MNDNATTKPSAIYVQAVDNCTEAQALAALYSLLFLPEYFRIIYTSTSVNSPTESKLDGLAKKLGLQNRVLYSDDPHKFLPITDICEENPEAFASSALFAHFSR